MRMIVIGQKFENGVSAITSTHPKDQKDGFFTAFKSIILISGLFSGHDTQPYFFRIVSPRRLWNALVPGKSGWQKVIVRKQAAKS